MKIHITYTGGTIGMISTPHGLTPGADMRGWLNRLIEGTQVSQEQVSFTELNPLIDSSNATPESWQAIIDDLWAAHDESDAFIVLHGTDTMSYTAAALSFAMTEFGKPIILTGSQLPLGLIESDATANVTGAINAALSMEAQGVTLFFGHHLFSGSRVTKNSSWAFEAFKSPSMSPHALTGAPWRWFPVTQTGEGWPKPNPYTRHDVAVVDMVPGISAARVKAAVTPEPEAVILRSYGVGNIPANEPGLVDVFAKLIEHDVPVIICSQCQQAVVLVGHYETGDAIAQAGAVGAEDMTFEATYAKTMFLLSQGLKGKKLAAWIPHPIAGELTSTKLTSTKQ